MKGKVSSWDENGITVEAANGKSETIAKTNIRRIQAKGNQQICSSDWSGGGCNHSGSDYKPASTRFRSIICSPCAGLGGLAGFGVGMSMRYSTVFEMP